MNGHGQGGANPYENDTRDAKGALKRLLRMMKTEKLRLISIIVLMLFAAAGQALAPKFLGDATNVVVDGMGLKIDFAKLAHVLVIVVVLYSVSSLANFFAGYIIRYTVQDIGYELRRQAQAKIDRLSSMARQATTRRSPLPRH